MKKYSRILVILTILFTTAMILPASGQAPPPPAHGQNGNQTAPNGTGCPLDRTQGLALALVFSLGYAGLALYQRGRKESLR
jgi:hypothetical protein